MKKNLLAVVGCMLVVAVLLSSCSKTGPAGATGATGATGAAGAAGVAGPAGPAGATGTANVIYSAWLDVTYSIDSIYTNGTVKDTTYFVDISAPKLTSDILSKGEIKVYWNQNSTTNPIVVPLPYFDGGDIINPLFGLTSTGAGVIELSSTSNFSTITVSGVKYWQYRYILIPGSVTGRSAINWNSYAEVKKYLNLPD